MKIDLVGYSCRLPGSRNAGQFWDVLDQGVCAVTCIPEDRFLASRYQHPSRLASGKAISFAAGIVETAFDFDAGFFGVSPREAIQMDPQQRMLAQVVWEALEHAGIPPSSLKGTQTGVFVGASSLDYLQNFIEDPGSVDAQLLTGNTLSIVSNRISFLLDLKGPSFTVDTACSSSLVALHQACAAIASGAIDTAIVGGVNFLGSPYPFAGFSRAFMLSETGLCRAFDAKGDGYVRAEGAVAIVIQSEAAKHAAGARARASIVGWGTNADGRTPGLAMPSSESQGDLIRQVYDRFGLDPEDLAFIEAHGTGTPVGDPLEAGALGRELGQKRTAPLPIGSVKTNIGHLEPASGLAGLLKAVLALEHDRLPRSLHFDTPNPNIPFSDLNLSVAGESVALYRRPGRLAGVNSFGFGGANAHIVLCDGEASRAVPQHDNGPIILSGASQAGLAAVAQAYAEVLPETPEGIAAFASASIWDRDYLEHRAVILDTRREAALGALRAIGDGVPSPHVVTGAASGLRGGNVFAFSGNGSQWPGMGRVALALNADFRRSLEETDAVFMARAGWSLVEALTAEDVAERITHADVVQPLLFALQVATAEALAAAGVRPDVTLGHSAGEVAAACVAGMISREDAIRIIDVRSSFQEPLRGKGTMAALVLPIEEAEVALADPAFVGVEIAAVNTSRSLTLAGPGEALTTFLKHARRKRWPYVRLGIEYPFHSSQLNPFRDDVIAALADIRPRAGTCRFISTVTGDFIEGERLDAEYWWRNVRARVEFAKGLTQSLTLKPRTLVEIGPSPILTSYISEVARQGGSTASTLASLEQKDDASVDPIRRTAARVLAHGGSVDVVAFAGRAVAHDIALPAYPWQNVRYKLEPSIEAATTFLPDLHPFLGMPPFRTSLTFHNHVDQETWPWLVDHRVENAVVFPGAGLFEMTLAATRQVIGEAPIELNDCMILRPMVISEGLTREVVVQVVEDERTVTCGSRMRGANEAPALHCKARFAVSPCKDMRVEMPAHMPVRIAQADEIYALMSAYHLNYGPTFRRLETARQLDDTTCEVRFTAASASWPQFIVDPAVVDSAFHAALWMLHGDLGEAPRDVTIVPTFVERIRVFRRGATIERALLKVTRMPGGGGVLDYLHLLDATGQVIATMSGGRFATIHINVQRQAPAGYRVYRAPRFENTARSPAAQLNFSPLDSVARELKPVDGPLGLDALCEASGQESQDIGLKAQILRTVLADRPDLIAEVTLCSSLSRGAVGRSMDVVAGGSPRAAALSHACISAVERIVKTWPKHAPLRVLALGLGDEAAVRRLVGLLPLDVGTLALSDVDSARLSRIMAAAPENASIKVIEAAQIASASDGYDVLLVCDPAVDWPRSADDVAAAHACLAPGGLLLGVRYAQSAFTALVRKARLTLDVIDDAALPDAYVLAGFQHVRTMVVGSHWGEALAFEARKSDVVAEAVAADTPAERPCLVAFEGVGRDASLIDALAKQGFLVRLDDGEERLADEILFVFVSTTDVEPGVRVLNLTMALGGLLRRLPETPVRLTIVGFDAGEETAALRAFVRVATNECPTVMFRFIDVDGGTAQDGLAVRIAREIASPGPDREIGIGITGSWFARAAGLARPSAPSDGHLRLDILGKGSLERLAWVPTVPLPFGDDDVEVQVEAAGLNFRDVMWSLGLLPPEALESGFAGATLGMECAGRVLRVGGRVSHVQIGDPVVAFASGAFAQKTVMPSFAVARRPETMGPEAAATLPVAFVTAWYALVHLARTQAGETVLVHGGAGAVGLAAIQILKLLGARIIASAGSPEKRGLVLDFGADHVVDSRSLAFEDDVKRLTEGAGVDVVLNSLAGEAMERSVGCLKPFGRFLELGKRDFFGNTRLGLRPFRRNLSYFGIDADQLLMGQRKLAQDLFRAVMAHLEAGRLHPLPWRGFEAQDVTAAFRLMQQSGHIGKIVIRPPAAVSHDVAKRVRADASYLIVGGLGGFGLALARRLAQRGAGRIILASRLGLVDDAAAAMIADMRALGTDVLVCAVDASSQSDLEAVIAGILPDKPLRGVFHTAMTLADAMIANLDEDRVAAVLRSKIDVAVSLERATASHALDWFVLFSSAAALLGNPGQAHYAAANSWLEGMARRRRAGGQPALAVGWGAISDVGYLTRGGEAGRALLARLSRHALSSDEALDFLESLLAADDLDPETAAVVFARLDWASLSRDLPILAAPLFRNLRTERDSSAQASGLSAELMLMSDAKARARILAELTTAIGKIMRIPESEIDVTQPLASLGVDSLMGVELRLAAEERFNVDVPLLSIGAAGSLADLGGLILKQMRAMPSVQDA